MESGAKTLRWVGSSLDDVRRFPDEVRGEVGHALYLAQCGGKHRKAEPLKGHRGASMLEIIENHDGNTYRAVYTVLYPEAVYVLHAFQKKSKQGIKTPQRELELVESRFKQLQALRAKGT